MLTGCPAAAGNPGFDPQPNKFAFPSGLLLDPRISTDPVNADGDPACTENSCPEGSLCTSNGLCRTPARWLFVTNANSDRRTNAGSLMAVDLDAFYRAAFDDPGAVHSAGKALSADSEWTENSPVCGSSSKDGRWCRRAANLPQVVECLEEPFVCSEETIQFGNFPGPAVAWDETPGDDVATLLMPVRGDPSVTYTKLSGGLDGDDIHFECGQASDEDGSRRCDDEHRLRFMRNDPEGNRLTREPFRILVTTEPGRPLAYVTHQGDPNLTLIALDGVAEDGVPSMIDQASILGWNAGRTYQGGFGIAQRPCDVETGNVPNSTLDCTRPLIYTSMRWTPELRAVTAINQNLPLCDPKTRDDYDPDLALTYCEAQAMAVRVLYVNELSTANVQISSSRPILADIGFSRTGDELYVVQANPGGLLRIDTSIGIDGEPIDVSAGQVEVCSQPTSLAIYDDGDSQYGLVTCYRTAEVFIVDLASLTVVGVARAGTGSDSMAVDLAREVVYVANTLDGTITVLDMSPARPTRFTQIARLGLQEPYKQ